WLTPWRGLAARWRLTFPINLLKRSDFCEEQITLRTPQFAIRTEIVSPEVIRQELIGLGTEFFKLDQMIHLPLFASRHRICQGDVTARLVGKDVRHTNFRYAEVIMHF